MAANSQWWPLVAADEGTIRETRDDSPPRPRKRQRTDSAIDISGTGRFENDCLVSAGPVEDDPEFYRSEAAANCILRVASHISPQERAAQPREHEDLDRLLLIAAISRHYRCVDLEAWAKDAILRTVTSNDVFIASCPSALFKRIIDCAIRTWNDSLLETTITRWAARIQGGDAPSVSAILVADMHELPRLRGVAYYYHIQAMIAQQTAVTERGATQFQTDPKLSNAQRAEIRVRGGMLGTMCGGAERALGVAAASNKINGMSSARVLALLAAMRDQLAADQELKTNIPPQCRLAVLEAVKKQAKIFEDKLADHFFGWL
ncbi:hypothetical protein B0H19DRAFT_1368788 [Mycena capillaripes]|nr:hypothetical protein B0H19DRAFT_1368788 [Mycena capillaripes]